MSTPIPHTEDQLTGMNIRVGANQLPPGQAPLIENVLPAPGRLGDVRPGFVGQLSGSGRTPLSPGPAWPPMDRAVRMPSGTASRLLLTDPAGRLRYYITGGTTVANIIEREGPGVALGDFAMADEGEHCQVVQDGKWLYGIEGGSTGRLFSIDTEETTWKANLLISLPTPTDPAVGYALHASNTCLLSGTYEWRVRVINSSTAAYPPTGTGAREGKHILAGSALIVQPSTVTVRGSKIAAAQISFEEPADTSDFTHYVIERRGGTLPTFWRVVAVVEFDTDDSTTSFGTPAASGYIWDATTDPTLRVFYDMVADVDLSDATVVTTGEDLPVGASCLALHAGRLWASVGNVLYFSRLLNSDYANIQDGLFWDTVPDPDDPLLPVLGGTLTIGAESNTQDKIKALAAVPVDSLLEKYGSHLFAFREQSITPITGVDGSNFSASAALDLPGRGLLARRALAFAEGVWLYQSPDGPMRFDGRTAQPIAEDLTTSNGAGSLVTADGTIGTTLGRSRIAYCWHRRRLWTFFPTTAEDLPTRAYVWQALTNGWVKITCDTDIVTGFVGAVSAGGSEDTAQLYLFGNNGQIFKWDQSATADKALSDSVSTEPIAWQITSRQFGQAEGKTRYAYKSQTPTALLIDVESSAGGTLAWRVEPPSGIGTGASFTFGAGKKSIELTSLSDARGTVHAVKLSGSATAALQINQFTLEVIKQGLQR